MRELTVKTSTPYRILLGSGLLDRAGELIREVFPKSAMAAVVCDSNVASLYGDRVASSLEKAGYSVFSCVFPAGEKSKQLSTAGELYGGFAARRLSRGDFVVALGGGVTGDLAGFAAATYLRGVPFVQIPTTLLSQIDSSVGGKTGVDLPQGKNLVGAFHQPRLVLIDPDTLSTLPRRYFSDGMGEAIKYGCIRSASLWETILEKDIRPGEEDLLRMIYECVDIKRQVVEHDEFDTGERMILNFGHTLGHSLEKLYGFGKLSHGEAVGIGMVLMARAGEKHGLTQPGTAEKIARCLQKYDLPVSDPATLTDLLPGAAVDKKAVGGTLNLVLLREIGDAFVHPIPREELGRFLEGAV